MAERDLAYEKDCQGRDVLVKSIESTQKVHLKFINNTSRPVDVWWRDFSGLKVHYFRLDACASYSQQSFVTHPWECSDVDTKERYVINNHPFYRAPSNTCGKVIDCIISRSNECDLAYETDDKCQKKLVKSIESTQSVNLKFINKTSRVVDVWWRDFSGLKVHYARLEKDAQYSVSSFVTHPWESTDVETKERYMINNNLFYRPPSCTGGAVIDCVITNDNDLAYECDNCQKKLVKSIESTQRVPLRFVNKTSRPVHVWWRDFSGVKVHYAQLEHCGQFSVDSFVTHPWECTDVHTKQRYLINNQPFFRPPSDACGNVVECNITVGNDITCMYR